MGEPPPVACSEVPKSQQVAHSLLCQGVGVAAQGLCSGAYIPTWEPHSWASPGPVNTQSPSHGWLFRTLTCTRVHTDSQQHREITQQSGLSLQGRNYLCSGSHSGFEEGVQAPCTQVIALDSLGLPPAAEEQRGVRVRPQASPGHDHPGVAGAPVVGSLCRPLPTDPGSGCPGGGSGLGREERWDGR